MGECYYAGRAYFESKRAAQRAMPRVRKFFLDMAAAHEDWQESRHDLVKMSECARRRREVFELLGLGWGKDDGWDSNKFAGELDSPALDEGWVLEREGDTIKFGGVVWHWANWAGLTRALERLGARKVRWRSEETVDIFELV